jgi:hypothetical protein
VDDGVDEHFVCVICQAVVQEPEECTECDKLV